MLRDSVRIPGLTVIWPVSAPPPGAAAGGGIARRLDRAQARLEAVETHLAGRAPQTPLTDAQAQEVREIRRLVATLTVELLGADHPLVAPLQDADGPRPGPRLVRLLSLCDRWSPGGA